MSDRFREVADIWNWLPAFRAVAETEHLPTATQFMHVTAPALSRTVRQLEDALEQELFNREGRAIRLNEQGAELLEAVRDAMRRVDDALASLRGTTYSGVIRWTSNWALSGVALRALRDVVAEQPMLKPRMLPVSDDLGTMLLRGELDLALTHSPMDLDGLVATRVGTNPHSVYCGASHELFGREDLSWNELEGREFASAVPDTSGLYSDGWPSDRPRKVVMEFAAMSVGFRACRDGELLAVLPDYVAREESGLWRLRGVPHSPEAWVTRRTPLGPVGPAELVVEKLVAAFGSA